MNATAMSPPGQSTRGDGSLQAAEVHGAEDFLIVTQLYVENREDLEEYLGHFSNEHEVQDIVHDVFLKLLRRHPAWISSPDARRLLFVAARNRSRDVRRKACRCEYRDPGEMESSLSNLGDVGMQPAGILELRRDGLDGCDDPDLQRVLTLLLSGMSLFEIADSEELSLATIKRRILRIKKIIAMAKKVEPFL